MPSTAYDQPSVVDDPVTCDGGLEDVDGSHGNGAYHQDEYHAARTGVF